MAFILTQQDLDQITDLVRGLPLLDSVSGIRSLSGEGNNLLNPNLGMADTPYLRLTPAYYGAADGLGNLRVNPIYAQLDPRAISNTLGQQEVGAPKAASGANLLFTAFGQYFDHGLTSLAKGGSGTIQIGGVGTGRGPASDNPADLTRATVVSLDESNLPVHLNKTPNYIDQNQAYGSNALVGVFLRQADGLGDVTARLASGGADPSSPGFDLLPSLRDLIFMHWENDTRFSDGVTATTFRTYYAGLVDSQGVIDNALATNLYRDFMGTGQPLLTDINPFISPLDHIVGGDGRVNENFTLTAVHTIWARNHNFHVENLSVSGFAGTAEELYQAAKIINEAEYQRVIYTEFTDVLLGGMRGSGSHGWGGYDATVDPSISHEFAAAAFRFGHSLVTQTVQVMNAAGEISDVALFDAFLNPTVTGNFQLPDGSPTTAEALAQMGYVPQPGYEQLGVSSILAGITQQAAEEVDVNIVDAIRNDLVRISADLFSFNVARGRDLGLGTLNQVRTALNTSQDPYVREAVDEWAGNMSAYSSWEDFQARNILSDTLIEKLKVAYPDLVLGSPEEIDSFQAINPDIVLVDGNTVKGIDRLDLWVGGLIEAHINSGMVGQTFWVIIHEQLDRLQEADRFYYLDRVDNLAFYDQIENGAEGGFGAIIARNTGGLWNGANVFLAGDALNLVGAPLALDFVAPEVEAFSPAEGAKDAAVGTNILLTFNEAVVFGAGNIELRLADGTVIERFVAGTSPQVTINERVLTINPTSDLIGGMQYFLAIDSGAVRDNTGNAYAGTTTFEFTTRAAILMGNQLANVLTGGAGMDEIFGLAGNDRLSGLGGNDLLDGGAGNDTLLGGLGNDTLTGGIGNDVLTGGGDSDTASYASSTAAVRVSLASIAAQNTGGAGTDTLSGIANLVGSSLNDTLTGNTGNNSIEGGDGNDTINGGAGNDTMSGGIGDDSYFVDSVTDVIIESPNSGTDTVSSTVTYTLASDVENLTLTGIAAINATGNGSNNVLVGNTGNNSIEGGDGNDTINGGAGNDTMSGGIGDDSYFVDSVTDVIIESPNSGTDTVSSTVTYTLASDVENLTLTGIAAINATGNGSNNVLVGNTGNNILSGGSGVDTMTGGTGNDIFQFSSLAELGDTITDFAIGVDKIDLSAVLLNNTQLTWIGTAAFTAAGQVRSTATTLEFNTDAILGSDFQLNLSNLNASLIGFTDFIGVINGTGGGSPGGGGTVTPNAINGTAASNILNGTTAADIINGNGGDDQIRGNLGADTLTGGAGVDRFRYSTEAEVLGDVITDFKAGGADRIDFQLMDANTGAIGNQTFAFRATLAFTGAGQLRYEVRGADTYVFGNTNADATTAEFQLVLSNYNQPLLGADFVL